MNGRKNPRNRENAQQFNGREGETATLLSRCSLNLSGLGGGFAPRHLSRSAFRVGKDGCREIRISLKIFMKILDLLQKKANEQGHNYTIRQSD